MSEDDKVTIQRMVYMGARRNHKGKKRFCWYELDGDATTILEEDPTNYALYHKQVQIGVGVGAIYDMKTRSVDSVVVNAGTYVGMLENDEMRMEWQTQHRAETHAIDSANKTKQAMAQRLDLARLEPFRRAYHKAKDSKARSFILGLVMQAVTSPTERKTEREM